MIFNTRVGQWGQLRVKARTGEGNRWGRGVCVAYNAKPACLLHWRRASCAREEGPGVEESVSGARSVNELVSHSPGVAMHQ